MTFSLLVLGLKGIFSNHQTLCWECVAIGTVSGFVVKLCQLVVCKFRGCFGTAHEICSLCAKFEYVLFVTCMEVEYVSYLYH